MALDEPFDEDKNESILLLADVPVIVVVTGDVDVVVVVGVRIAIVGDRVVAMGGDILVSSIQFVVRTTKGREKKQDKKKKRIKVNSILFF